jgi:hypothetical protein
VKVGDLVKVHPACVGYYVITEKLGGVFHDGHQMWRLAGNPRWCGSQHPVLDMSEKWMEIVSSSPHLEKS